jgi:hypothetical protein
MNIKVMCVAAASAMALWASGAEAEPFAFQGQLNDQGVPADGLYDLEFTLFGIDSGGTPIGMTVMLEDQQVSSGTFNVELDFGDVFDGSARWIEVGVRNGDSVDAFTGLSPRLKVGSAPQASYASKSAVANTLSEPFWTEAPGILFFGEDGGNDQFFFNRDRDIDPTDVMVVHANQNGMSGITLSTWTNGMPYFGYATGGFMRAKTYYDPITDAWVVNKGGDQLEIDSNNDVIITNNLIVGGTITSADGPGEPTIGYKSYTPDSIWAGFDFARVFNSFAGAIVSQGSTLYLRADIDLPHGATISNIRIEYVDRLTNPNLSVQLWSRDMTTLAFTPDTLAVSTGADAGMVQVMSITPNPGIVIDNTAFTYALRFFSSTGSWPGNGNLGVRNILIEYTMP